jgi:DNA-directed RNA polymerase specialized sigma24 family protein
MIPREPKRSLTPEAFGKFLRCLSSDDEQAVREYQSIRKKLIRYFVNKGCPVSDELFDQTVDIVVGKIEELILIASPLAYCYGVAKNVLRKWVRDRERKNVVLPDDLASPEFADSEAHERELRCLEHCVGQLRPEDQEVVSLYHSSQGREQIETRRALANRIGGTNTLRVRACRIRKNLRSCVVNCLSRASREKSLGEQA